MIVCLLTLVTFQQQPLKVSSLFSDNMVLQREVPVPIFGTAMPGQTITVTVGEFSATAKVGDDGKWLATMPAMKAGGPFVETIRSADATVSIKNVMVGEVWLCSGQSNMERPESAAGDYAQAIDEADPAIRMFTVSKSSREAPRQSGEGRLDSGVENDDRSIFSSRTGLWPRIAQQVRRSDWAHQRILGWNQSGSVDQQRRLDRQRSPEVNSGHLSHQHQGFSGEE